MIKLKDLIPLNLASEKEKFFTSGFKYNPQFIYEKNIDQKELTRYGKPNLWYLFLAKRILKKHQQTQNDKFDESINSNQFLTQEKIEEFFTKRLAQYGLEKEYKIVFSENFISRVAINLKNKEVKILLPIKISAQEIEAILAHEVDTHVLRQYNYEQQIWFGKKKKYGFKEHLRTEEGLAIINEMISRQQTLAYKAAANYLAINLALKKDFVSVFEFFYKIWQDPERSWTWTLKKKRGLTDTQKKGAYTKDIVYFEGLIKVLKYLRKNNYDPRPLYCGKIDVDDLNKAIALQNNQPTKLPIFLQNNFEDYQIKLKALCANHIH